MIDFSLSDEHANHLTFSLRYEMPDFAGAVLAANANYTSGGAGAMNPTTGTLPPPTISPPAPSPGDFQQIQKCPADYNQIPHGWRQSPFMGNCGYKIQAKNFYSADTPCYPIQDLSCMGPTQKRVWAGICATEFPCKPLEPVKPSVVRPHDEPSAFARLLGDILAVISTNGFLLLGVTLGSCLSVTMRQDEPPLKKPNDSDEDET